MKKIVMIGTRFDTMGGISSVVNVYRAAGMFERFPIRYLATHRDGGGAAKLRQALGALLQFIFLLVTGQVGVVHIHTSSRASFWRKFPFFLLARLCGRATIVHVHSGAFHNFYDGCSPRRQALIRYVFDHASRVIVLSDSWKQWFATITDNSRIESIPNPVQVPAQAVAPGAAAPVVLMLGRLGQPKGTYDLVNAAAELVRTTPTLALRLGGDGDLDGVAQRAAGLGIGTNVELLGWVTGAGKEQALRSARVYVLPSYNEGLPMSVLEAMAAGLPVVTTPVGGIPSAVTDGVEGFLVAPGDVAALAARLDELLHDDALAGRMGRAARLKIQSTFSVEAILPRIEALYGELGIARPPALVRARPAGESK